MSQPTERQLFRMLEHGLAPIFGFPGLPSTTTDVKKRKRAPFESEADEARIERLGRLRKMDPAAQLSE